MIGETCVLQGIFMCQVSYTHCCKHCCALLQALLCTIDKAQHLCWTCFAKNDTSRYQNFTRLSPLLAKYAQSKHKILQIGTGTSPMAQEMVQVGKCLGLA